MQSSFIKHIVVTLDNKPVGVITERDISRFLENGKTAGALEEISVEQVMINGRLYDANTMDEIGNRPKKRKPFYWENNRYNQAFPWHEETQSFMRPTCGCQVGHQ